MNRELRTLTVSILTVFFLAFSNYLQSDTFIFTFPINEYLFLGTTLYFAFFNLKENKFAYILLLGFAVVELLSEPYNLEFFCNAQQLTFYDQYAISDWLKLLAHLLFLILCYDFFKKSQWIKPLLWLLVCLMPILIGHLLHITFLVHFSILIFTLLMAYCKEKVETGYLSLFYLMILLSFLHFTKAIYIDL